MRFFNVVFLLLLLFTPIERKFGFNFLKIQRKNVT